MTQLLSGTGGINIRVFTCFSCAHQVLQFSPEKSFGQVTCDDNIGDPCFGHCHYCHSTMTRCGPSHMLRSRRKVGAEGKRACTLTCVSTKSVNGILYTCQSATGKNNKQIKRHAGRTGCSPRTKAKLNCLLTCTFTSTAADRRCSIKRCVVGYHQA